MPQIAADLTSLLYQHSRLASVEHWNINRQARVAMTLTVVSMSPMLTYRPPVVKACRQGIRRVVTYYPMSKWEDTVTRAIVRISDVRSRGNPNTWNYKCNETSRRLKRLSKKEGTGYASRLELHGLLQKQCHLCDLSGLPLGPKEASIDHVIPVSDGGTSGIGNLQWLHPEVNRMKGTLSLSRFVELCSLVAGRHGGRTCD